MHDAERKARAEKRASWPVRKYRLGEEPVDDLRKSTTAEERLGMMWELAVQAWNIAGLPIPDYKREDTPVRVIRNRKSEETQE